MFGSSAIVTSLPMSMFAISILTATRLTGSMYPITNLMGQLGIFSLKLMDADRLLLCARCLRGRCISAYAASIRQRVVRNTELLCSLLHADLV